MKNLFKTIVLTTFIFTISFTGVFAQGSNGYNSEELSKYFEGVLELIENRYDDEIDKEKMVENTLRSMFGSLDDYTTFYTNDEVMKFMQGVTGEYSGIGVIISNSGENTIVSKVFENSPAQKSGLIIDDIIYSVDDEIIKGYDVQKVSTLIMGPRKTNVKLGVIRNSNDERIYIDIERNTIKVNPVFYKTFDDIGYIKLDSFNANATSSVRNVLKEFDEENIEKLILDLRNNPGGELSQAINISQLFVDNGIITSVKYKSDEYKDEVYKSTINENPFDLVVLVNKNSASASEILAGAIKDSNSGQLVGTKTYGKAKVQQLIPIVTPQKFKDFNDENDNEYIDIGNIAQNPSYGEDDESLIGWVKITIGNYFTPNGTNINKNGITPNVIVRNPQKLGDYIKPLEVENKYDLGNTSYEIFKVKAMMKILGYDIDKIDYNLDQKTFYEIAKFQKDNDLFPYGVLDFSTQNMLNLVYEEDYLKKDRQLNKAFEILNH